jgi:hypothetical protein
MIHKAAPRCDRPVVDGRAQEDTGNWDIFFIVSMLELLQILSLQHHIRLFFLPISLRLQRNHQPMASSGAVPVAGRAAKPLATNLTG